MAEKIIAEQKQEQVKSEPTAAESKAFIAPQGKPSVGTAEASLHRSAGQEPSAGADKPSRKTSSNPDFRNLVRIIDVDVPGEVSIFMALTRVKGVSFMLANAVSNVLKINRVEQCGNFSPQEIEKIEDVMKHPDKYNLPKWLFNRRKDRDTGEDLHLVGSDLDFAKNMDIRFLKKIRVYRGSRHSKGSKKVRGQKTRSSGRKGSSMGVAKKKEVKSKVSKA